MPVRREGFMSKELRPLMGTFERSFQKEAFKELQKGFIAAGLRVVLTETPEIDEALSQIGMLYHKRVPEDF